jgi:hypothetical protein
MTPRPHSPQPGYRAGESVARRCCDSPGSHGERRSRMTAMWPQAAQRIYRNSPVDTTRRPALLMQWAQTKSWRSRSDTAASEAPRWGTDRRRRCSSKGGPATAGSVYELNIHPPRAHGNVNRDQRMVTRNRNLGDAPGGHTAQRHLPHGRRTGHFPEDFCPSGHATATLSATRFWKFLWRPRPRGGEMRRVKWDSPSIPVPQDAHWGGVCVWEGVDSEVRRTAPQRPPSTRVTGGPTNGRD